MKLIAKSNFSQGLNNPLQLPGGQKHVERGTVFSIGGDLPFEKLSKDEHMLHGQLSHCICPLDSEEGKQILAEVEAQKKLEAEKVKTAHDAIRATADKWYQKPVGIVLLATLGIVLATIIVGILSHFFPRFFH